MTLQDSQISNVYEPVLFANSKDPLGTHFIGNKDLNNDDTNISSEGSSSGARKQSRLSLSRILLSLDSNASKQKSLQHILNALQIIYAREAVVAAIAPHTNNVTAPAATDNNNDNVSTALNAPESHRSTGEDDESPDDAVDIAVVGGVAACRGEVSSTSLSLNTSPESEDGNNDFYPVFAGPTTSKTQSLPRGGTGRRVSYMVGQ